MNSSSCSCQWRSEEAAPGLSRVRLTPNCASPATSPSAVFSRPLVRERVSRGLWLAMALGLFGSYGENETVDVHFRRGGKTQVVSTRIFQLVESMHFGEAHQLAAGLLAFAFAVLLALFLIERRTARTGL